MKAVQWCTFLHWSDTGGAMTRYWQSLQAPWSKRGGRNNQLKQDHCWAPSTLWNRSRDQSSVTKLGRISCKQTMGNRGWPWEQTLLSRGSTVLNPEAWHHHVFARGVYSALEERLWGKCRETERKKGKYQQFAQDCQDKSGQLGFWRWK